MESAGGAGRHHSFGRLLRAYRVAAGLTQEELAERAELSARGLRYLEQDLRRPYRDTAQRLADALSLAAEDHRILTAAARWIRPPDGAVPAGTTTVPVPPSPLIGREREVDAVVEMLLREDSRLVSLIGIGGVGKTRLALEVATRLQAAFADGMAWVALAPLTDSSLVGSAIAQALDLMETPFLPLPEILQASLRDRQMLLLLDNFEHVAAAAPLLSDTLATCPRVKLLVTSRLALRLRGEHLFAVSPLTTPDASPHVSVYSLAANPAVDLFLRRAQEVMPSFALKDTNAAAIASICRQLEGLPLALELAAARVRALPPSAMVHRLQHRLSFLTGGALDLPARQRTMRETIGWSYGLLNQEEQALFRRLSVFAGGCALPAIEGVCNSARDLPLDLFDLVEALVRSSLLRLEERPEDEPRFVMLETVREYALEQLTASSEEDELRREHAGYYLGVAEQGAHRFFGPGQGQWLDEVEQEHDNFRAALHWYLRQREAGMGLRLAAALWPFWYTRGHLEGRSHLAALLGLPEATEPVAARAASLVGAGQLALWQGDHEAAQAYLEEGIALHRTLSDERGTASALLVAGFLARVRQEYPAAQTLLEEALALARANDHTFIIAASLHHLGLMAVDARGDYRMAHELLAESLAIYRELGLLRFIGLVSVSLGDVVRAQGNYAGALRLFREGLAALVTVGEKLAIPSVLDSFAHLAMDERDAGRATRLSGAATSLRDSNQTAVWPAVQRERERWLAAAQEALGDEAFQTAWAEGQAMTDEQAIAAVLGEAAEQGRAALRPGTPKG